MNNTKTTETRTTVRHPGILQITGYSILAADPYGENHRDIIEIIGDGDQIVAEVVAWVAMRHKDAQGGADYAIESLQRLAGAMGLEYPATTGEA